MNVLDVTLILALPLLAVAYAGLVRRRNRRLVRPPILGRAGEPIEERRFEYSDGETVDLVDVGPETPGAGHVLVLVPGADGMKETFRFQVPALARSHRVIAASLRRRLAPADTLDRLADDVAELAGSLAAGPVVVLGQSLGGAIAMRLASRRADLVSGLVLCNTLARVGYEHVGLNRALLAPVAMAATRYLPTSLARALARLWSRLEVWIYDSTPGASRVIDYALWTGPRTVPSSVSRARVQRLRDTDLRPQLPSIRASALVLKGPRDHYVPPAWSHEIVALVPRATYQEVDASGHCSHLSMPASFNLLVLDWLETLPVEAPAGRSPTPAKPVPGTGGNSAVKADQ